MLPNRYRKSRCRGNWLHDFKTIKQTNMGFLERCSRCGVNKHFPVKAPNLYFLQYHIKNIIRADDPLFRREWPNAII
jgi:hypothetical protein